VSFEVVSLCLYALIPVFLQLMKAPLVVTFCNSPHLSQCFGLNLFNTIKLASFNCFLQLWEQEEVTWSKVRGVGKVCEGWNVMFRQKFIWGDGPVSRGTVMVQDPIAGMPLLRAMSVHSIMEALQDCFVEFLIYCLSSRDILMMNQPFNVEEHNQHGLDIGLHLPCFLQSRRWCSFPLGGHLLCFRVIPVNPAFVTSDYRGHEVGIILGSLTEVSANWHVIVLLLRREETRHKFCWHISFAVLQLEFSGMYRMLFQLTLQPLW